MPFVLVKGFKKREISFLFEILLYFPDLKSRSYAHGRKLNEELDGRRASSRGLIPRAKIKTVKMTFVIVFGEYD